MKKLILASQSPRRKMLLEQIGVPFKVFQSDADETINENIGPKEYAAVLSERKAEDVTGKLSGEELNSSVVLAADTIVVLGHHILGKPQMAQEAFQTLLMLSGKWHEVMTGVTLLDAETGRKMTHVEKTRVKIRSMDHKAIWRYIDSGEPFDKAGGYGIQGLGALLVEKLEGCYYNVVGLPLYSVSIMLGQMGIETLLINSSLSYTKE